MKPKRLKPREQGDIGELSAMEWLASKGAHIYVPIGHSPDVDLIAAVGDRMLRVEVKTATHRNELGRWDVLISTRGGNQSWTGLVKYFRPERCDYLFVHVGDGRRWFIPTSELTCRSGLTLGGPKYAEFEIETGRPLAPNLASPVLQSSAPGECPSGQRELTVNEPAQPSQVRILPPPSGPFHTEEPETDPEKTPSPPPVGRTRLSANHQLTIPLAPFEAAELEVGNRFRVEAEARGRIVITRIEEYAEEHASQLALGAGRESDRDGERESE